MQYSRVYLLPNPFIFLSFNAGPRICLGQQFAYNEISFFMIRLLQTFPNITPDTPAQHPELRVPKAWANCPGRKGKEKIWPKSHITLYMHVSDHSTMCMQLSRLLIVTRVAHGLGWRNPGPQNHYEGTLLVQKDPMYSQRSLWENIGVPILWLSPTLLN